MLIFLWKDLLTVIIQVLLKTQKMVCLNIKIFNLHYYILPTIILFSENCCQNITEFKSILKLNNKSVEFKLKQFMTQIFMLNNSNTRICCAFKTMDQKIQMIMKSKTRQDPWRYLYLCCSHRWLVYY